MIFILHRSNKLAIFLLFLLSIGKLFCILEMCFSEHKGLADGKVVFLLKKFTLAQKNCLMGVRWISGSVGKKYSS
jgi:hypothetical protein